MNDNRFNWFAYAEQTQDSFIERFADLDAGEHPDKIAEIAEAKRIRQSRQDYTDVTNEILDEMTQCKMAMDAFDHSCYTVKQAALSFNRQGIVAKIGERYRFLKERYDTRRNFGIKAEDVQKRIEQLRGER